ncbi:8-amino-7-oxononanoate synthase [Acidihalobacter aeolianus]|uniref:8-amino-7-oxononanoate synthase n=1 Tax=Acidihalobacter aeolianus TaxID=2792603 RepID=A0A1D8K930_9GAMM|nr:aminotransferase class I/II-fold pyridoxal phosphate-dependent enzyme [Acidihalobacter aeolianus]AOV17478.1 8-amino-7-oxononanoate synthase [Acidihalobacter aeolianus]
MRRISGQIKDQLIQKALQRRMQQIDAAPSAAAAAASANAIPPEFYDFALQPGYQQVRLMREGGQKLGVDSPFFLVHEGSASAHSRIDGHEVLNYASYNYLDLAAHPRVREAAQAAIAAYGTTVSASRIVAGERPFHRELERSLAALYEADDALAMVSGHATNVSAIGHLLGPRDLILHDEYAHNSIVLGSTLSGAQRVPFTHNDLDALEALLRERRTKAERTLIVVEGIYSMDGDFPDLPRLLEIKQRHHAWLMVDEAHGLGVLGSTGHGLAEHFCVDPREVDIWMGTLSKTLSSCGGFIAGSQALIDNLRFLAPGFLYSVGLAPPLAAAAQAALEVMREEPERVARLQAVGHEFVARATALKLDTGTSSGHAVVPWIVGGSLHAVRLSALLLQEGVNVQPILYPAVPEKRARLRFFMSSAHSETDLERTFEAISRVLKTHPG